MRDLNLLRASALVYIVAIVAFGGLGQVVPDGEPIIEPGHRLWFFLSGSAATLSGFTCWFGAIGLWLHRRRAGVGHLIGAIVLIPYGFLFGWIYLLAARDPLER